MSVKSLRKLAENRGREFFTNYMSLSDSIDEARDNWPKAEWEDIKSYIEASHAKKLSDALFIAAEVIELYEQGLKDVRWSCENDACRGCDDAAYEALTKAKEMLEKIE